MHVSKGGMFQAEVPGVMTYKAGGGAKPLSTKLAVVVLGGLSLSSERGHGDGDRRDGGARRRDSGEARKAGDSEGGGGVGGRVRLGEQQVSKCLNHGNPQCDARNRRT
jgi:hypothetical protein